jgi:large subunit ribosomal protein L17
MALIKSLLRAVLISERIITTEAKAKALRPWLDKMITWAKQDTLHARRQAYRWLGDHQLVVKLFNVIGPRYKDINGGYCRVIDYKSRKGDAALLSIFELTKRTESPLKDRIKKEHKEAEKPVDDTPEHKGHHDHEAKGHHEEAQPQKPKSGLISGVHKIFKNKKSSKKV